MIYPLPLLGFHLQKTVPNWKTAVRPNMLIKATGGWEIFSEIPHARGWVRHVTAQPMPTSNYEEKANEVFERFVNPAQPYWQHVNYVQAWNEFYANDQKPVEREHWTLFDIACAKVWVEWRNRYPVLENIRFVNSEAAVGNDIPIEVAAASVQYNSLIGYHAYTPIADGVIMPDEGEHPDGSEINAWKYYDGRWEEMDKRWTAQGIYVDWIFGEGGAVRDARPWRGVLQPNDGWKHEKVFNGDIDLYLNMLTRWLDRAVDTDAYRRGAIHGMTLFTTGGGERWRHFEIEQPHMDRIADLSVNYPYPPQIPIKPPTSTNLISNGSFEDTNWKTDTQGNQHPKHWSLAISNVGDMVRGFEVSGIPECVHKKCGETLPLNECAGEPDALILEGVQTYKIFTRAKWAAEISQTLTGLTPGENVEVTIPFNCHFDGRSDEYDLKDTLIELRVSGGSVWKLYMTKELSHTWQQAKMMAKVPNSGALSVSLAVSVAWEHDTAFFIDAAKVEYKVVSPCRQPRIQYARMYHYYLPDATEEQQLYVYNRARVIGGSAGGSADDMLYGGELENVTGLAYGLTQEQKEAYKDWRDDHYPDSRLEFAAYPTEPPPPPARAFGVDVSHHQGKIDWDKMAAWRDANGRRVEFAYLKCTDGKYFKDPQFPRNWDEALRVGVVPGAYHYLRNEQNGLVQAGKFIEHFGNRTPRLPHMCDVEDRESPFDEDTLLSWLTTIKSKYNHMPGIYTGTKYWNNFVNYHVPIVNKSPLWINSGWKSPQPVIPRYNWQQESEFIWQFKQLKGEAFGVQTLVIDVNLAAVSLADMLL